MHQLINKDDSESEGTDVIYLKVKNIYYLRQIQNNLQKRTGILANELRTDDIYYSFDHRPAYDLVGRMRKKNIFHFFIIS